MTDNEGWGGLMSEEIAIDYECSAWPDEWWGVSINHCCVEHDLATGSVHASDVDLFWCVIQAGAGDWRFWALAGGMFAGVKLFRPGWRVFKRLQARWNNRNE